MHTSAVSLRGLSVTSYSSSLAESLVSLCFFFFFQAEDGIRDVAVTGVQTCALPISAKFILHVEKDTVWRRFNEDKFWRKHNCILTHGGGQPPRGVRRMLHRLHHELSLPVYCLLDNDPWGYYIYSVIKQGSINLAYESRRMAIPAARFLGLRRNDYERCQLNPSVQIQLNEQDIKRARQIAQYPWFRNKKPWQKEIDLMLKNGFKLEVEALISKDISYVTEEFVPARLEEGNFLD